MHGLYLVELLQVQSCEGLNKYQQALTNVTAPKGRRRLEFEAAVRQRVMQWMAFGAWNWVLQSLLVRALWALLIVLSFPIGFLALGGPYGLLATALATASATVYVLAPTVYVTVFDNPVPRWAIRLWVGTAFAAGTVFIVYLLSNATPGFRLGALAISGAQAALFIASIVVIDAIFRAREKRWMVTNLDAWALAQLLDLYHFVTVHGQELGTFKSDVVVRSGLGNLALGIVNLLPRRLLWGPRHHESGNQNASREIAQSFLQHMNDLARANGRKELMAFLRKGIGLVAYGQWLEVPRSPVPPQQPSSRRTLKAVRSAIASVTPLLIVVAATYLLPGARATLLKYGVTLAVGCFVVYVLTWIDPELPKRLEAAASLRGMLKQSSNGKESP